MSYVPMKELLVEARKNGYSVGAFNIVNRLTACAAVAAAEALRSPIILQTSVSTVRQIGPKALIGYLRALAESAQVPVAVHLDHCKDPALLRQCIDLGWSSVMIDMSAQPFAVNLEETARAVQYAAKTGATVEGELGAIFGVEDDIVVSERQQSLADPEKSMEYVQSTGIDAFAPAIGTAHGLYKGTPKVEFELFSTLAKCIDVPLVVHGGTGLSRETFRTLVELGAAKINVSTAIKIAYCGAMYDYTAAHRTENNPLKLDQAAFAAVQSVVEEHMRMFGSEGRL